MNRFPTAALTDYHGLGDLNNTNFRSYSMVAQKSSMGLTRKSKRQQSHVLFGISKRESGFVFVFSLFFSSF